MICHYLWIGDLCAKYRNRKAGVSGEAPKMSAPLYLNLRNGRLFMVVDDSS